MAFGERLQDRAVLADASLVGDNTATKLYGPFFNDGFRAVRVALFRHSQVGSTVTLDAKVQWAYKPSASPADLLDHAGNAIAFVQWTDTQTGLRYVDLGPQMAPGADADGVLVYGTNYKAYETFIPYELYVLVTQTQASGKDNNISLVIEGSPA